MQLQQHFYCFLASFFLAKYVTNICNTKEEKNRRELFSLWLFISVFSTFQPLHFSVFYSATVSHNFSLPLSLCLHLSLFYSLPPLHLITVFHFSFSLSLTLQLLAFVYSLSVSLSLSQSGRQRDDGFVAVVTPSFSLSLLAPAASPSDDIQIQQFSHVKLIQLCLLGNKMRLDNMKPLPHSIHPSILPSSIHLSAILAHMLITHSASKDNRRIKTNELSLTIITPPSTHFSSQSACFSTQMFIVSSR